MTNQGTKRSHILQLMLGRGRRRNSFNKIFKKPQYGSLSMLNIAKMTSRTLFTASWKLSTTESIFLSCQKLTSYTAVWCFSNRQHMADQQLATRAPYPRPARQKLWHLPWPLFSSFESLPCSAPQQRQIKNLYTWRKHLSRRLPSSVPCNQLEICWATLQDTKDSMMSLHRLLPQEIRSV